MRRLLLALALILFTIHSRLQSQEQQIKAPGHYLFAWTGDAAHKGKDFLAVIDADPASKSYGRLVTTLATDQQSVRIHHTEYVMPVSGMLFANDHDAGRTFTMARTKDRWAVAAAWWRLTTGAGLSAPRVPRTRRSPAPY
jgi:hypothetical protein